MATKKPTASMKAALLGTPKKPMTKGTRGRSPGCAKSGGRSIGSPRSLTPIPSAQIRELCRQGIWNVFQRLGGEEWLYRLAVEQPGLFLSQCWSRIAPVPARDDGEAVQNVINVNSMSDFEVARRIAFILASGQHALEQMHGEKGQLINATPARPSPAMIPLEPVQYPSQFSEEELRELAHKGEVDRLVADTRGNNSDYGGSALEQGFSRRRSLF